MAQNNNNTEEQNTSEFIKLDETMYAKQAAENLSRAICSKGSHNQQSLNGFGRHDNMILRHQPMQSSSSLCQPASSGIFGTPFISNQFYQECNSLSQQRLHQGVTQDRLVSNATNSSSVYNETKPITTPIKCTQANSGVGNDLSRESNESTLNSKATIAAELDTKIYLSDTTNTLKSNVMLAVEDSNAYTDVGLPKMPSGFRVAEFVLKHLGSVPGEERFYNWSNKTRDFVRKNLSEESQEKFYSNVASPSNSHPDQPTSDVMTDNKQQKNKRSSGKNSKRGSVAESPDNKPQNPANEISPKNKKASKSTKNAILAAEKDRVLKKYSHRLMRRKPMSWQLQEHSK